MDVKMMIVVRKDLHMRKGKIAAQAGHACVEAALMALAKEGRLADVTFSDGYAALPVTGTMTPLTEWFATGTAKVCVSVDSEEALLAVNEQARQAGLLTAVITDAGLTEFHGEPTRTCLAIEPAEAERVDPITGALMLY